MKSFITKTLWPLFISVDLGKTQTIFYHNQNGIILNDATAIAYNKHGKVIAYGKSALSFQKIKGNNFNFYQPFSASQIKNYDSACELLRLFLKDAKNTLPSLVKPTILTTYAPKIASIEKKSLKQAFISAGATDVILVNKALAIAKGADIDHHNQKLSLFIDIGATSTTLGIFSFGSFLYSSTINIGGDTLEQNIINFLKKKFKFLICKAEAEKAKIKLASAILPKKIDTALVYGKDLMTSMPCKAQISSVEIFEAIFPIIKKLMLAIESEINLQSSEIITDFYDHGNIFISGRGSSIKFLKELIEEYFSVPCYQQEHLKLCIVKGLNSLLQTEGKTNLISMAA